MGLGKKLVKTISLFVAMGILFYPSNLAFQEREYFPPTKSESIRELNERVDFTKYLIEGCF